MLFFSLEIGTREWVKKSRRPHSCTVPTAAASLLPGMWGGFPAPLLVRTLPSVATVTLWLLPPSTCDGNWREVHIPQLSSFLAGDLDIGAAQGEGELVCHGGSEQGNSHPIPQLAATLNIQQVIWQRPLTRPHPGTECIPTQSLLSFWRHQFTMGWDSKSTRRRNCLPHPSWGPTYSVTLKPANYVADPKWKWCKTSTVVGIR